MIYLNWERVKYAQRHFGTKGQICTKRHFCTKEHFCKKGHFYTNNNFPGEFKKNLPTKGKG